MAKQIITEKLFDIFHSIGNSSKFYPAIRAYDTEHILEMIVEENRELEATTKCFMTLRFNVICSLFLVSRIEETTLEDEFNKLNNLLASKSKIYRIEPIALYAASDLIAQIRMKSIRAREAIEVANKIDDLYDLAAYSVLAYVRFTERGDLISVDLPSRRIR